MRHRRERPAGRQQQQQQQVVVVAALAAALMWDSTGRMCRVQGGPLRVQGQTALQREQGRSSRGSSGLFASIQMNQRRRQRRVRSSRSMASCCRPVWMQLLLLLLPGPLRPANLLEQHGGSLVAAAQPHATAHHSQRAVQSHLQQQQQAMVGATLLVTMTA